MGFWGSWGMSEVLPPAGWAIRPLDELIDVCESGIRPAGGVSIDSGEIPSLGGENILQEGGVTIDRLNKISKEFFDKMPKGHLQFADVLINKDGANTGKVGLFEGQFPAAINEHLFLLRGKKGELSQRFLYYFLLSSSTQKIIRQRITGSAQPGLNSKFLKDFPILHPKELAGQDFVGSVLSTLDDLVLYTESLISKYQSIKQGLMHDLFTRGIAENGKLRPRYEDAPHLYKETELGWVPKEWKVDIWGTLTPENAPICYGIVQPGEFKNGGVPVIAIFNLGTDYSSCHLTSKEIEGNYVRSRVEAGDVLLSVKGSTGRVDVVPVGFSGNISRDVARIRPRSRIVSSFLRYLLTSPKYQQVLDRAVVGTTRAEISIGVFRNIPALIPSSEEQEKIGLRLSSVDSRLESLGDELRKIKHLKAGLMHDLLTGKVRVKLKNHQQEAA